MLKYNINVYIIQLTSKLNFPEQKTPCEHIELKLNGICNIHGRRETVQKSLGNIFLATWKL